MSSRPLCLVTGASGYIGGRLVPELLAAGYRVRCMARDPAKLGDRPWSGDVEVAQADVTDPEAVRRALDGADVAYYLIHSLGTGASFEARDRASARTFAGAARDAGVSRIVYLGGIISGQVLSPHLRSRGEVGDILLGSGVPTAALQAAVIIGSGSASFEMLRYLTERLPAMITPKWVETRIQPIAVRDVLRYLVGAAGLPAGVNRRFDIGGPGILTYADMMQRYAAVAKLTPRVLIRVPLLTPGLSAHWVGLVTPVPSGLAKPLVESLRNEVVASEHDIADYIPDPPEGLLPLDQAIALALRHTREGDVSTSWTSAGTPGAPSDPLPSDPPWSGGSLYVDERTSVVHATPEALWTVLEGIGGTTGWYSLRAAWAVRGLADRFVGGVGLRRGRRDPRHLRVGDALDFWRVEAITPGELLRLRAEMKLPGLAWLELSIGRGGNGETRYRQRAIFQPHGLAGHAYWRAISPFHGVVFGGMLRNITAAAEKAPRLRAVPAARLPAGLGGLLDRGEGDRNAAAGRRAALADLGLRLIAVALAEAGQAGRQEGPGLGQLGAAVRRGEGVAPAHPAVVHLERELAAAFGRHDLGAGLPDPVRCLVPAGEPGAGARAGALVPPAGRADGAPLPHPGHVRRQVVEGVRRAGHGDRCRVAEFGAHGTSIPWPRCWPPWGAARGAGDTARSAGGCAAAGRTTGPVPRPPRRPARTRPARS